METRSLVKAGAVSYTVSLPKKWIEKNKLKRGDTIYIEEKSPTKLLISTDISQENIKSREIIINIDKKKIESIKREITSAYINNYSTLTIMGNELDALILEIRKAIHDFVALEIVEQTSTKIVAKDFLNLKEVSTEKTIRRMDMIVRSMIGDSISSIDGKNMSQSIYYRDFEVNRLFFLMLRLLKGCFKDQTIINYFNLSNLQVLSSWNMTINLENIADNTKNICEIFKSLSKKSDKQELKMIYTKIKDQYLNALKSYYNKDKNLAEKVASERKEVIGLITKYIGKGNNTGITLITENLKETETFICNIARLVLDED